MTFKKTDNNYLNNLNANLSEDVFEITQIERNSLDTKKKIKSTMLRFLWMISESFLNLRAINFITFKPV